MSDERRTHPGIRASAEAQAARWKTDGVPRFEGEVTVEATGTVLGRAAWVNETGWTFALEAGWRANVPKSGRVTFRVTK